MSDLLEMGDQLGAEKCSIDKCVPTITIIVVMLVPDFTVLLFSIGFLENGLKKG